ncbi:translesion DNA synthesis-associated protein ImuA [Pseudacidovorax intermedius]|uniref:translesion DNA synthesis-associated protein ImuA n=1 Tax=Pseudacidovorax intermedius TaxID=433924 RepID=UPI0026F0FB9D|nr:translesion DNA synthesis-associated protein ImuA [Pseudacidovorax intermedius]
MRSSTVLVDLSDAPEGVWRGDELGEAGAATCPSGHPGLDAELPGGGWPLGAMTELLQPDAEAPLWPVLLPSLARAVAERGQPVALIGPPHEPFGPALAAGGLPLEALLWVRADAAPARLWACEQALRCAEVAAVLAWLPQARLGELRRLQLAAARHGALLFVCRPDAVAPSASPARLRLRLQPRPDGQLDVHLLKRRGPPLAHPLPMPGRGTRLGGLLDATRPGRPVVPASTRTHPMGEGGATVVRLDLRRALRQDPAHALARASVAA